MPAVDVVQAISTVDLDNLQRRLNDCENRVFRRHKDRIVGAIKAAWTGWLYRGRPTDAQRNVSLKAWDSRIETTNRVVLYVLNSRDYSSFVHRSGSTDIEWQQIWATVESTMIPPLVKDLQDEIAKTLNAPANPRQIGNREGGTTASRTLLG